VQFVQFQWGETVRRNRGRLRTSDLLSPARRGRPHSCRAAHSPFIQVRIGSAGCDPTNPTPDRQTNSMTETSRFTARSTTSNCPGAPRSPSSSGRSLPINPVPGRLGDRAGMCVVRSLSDGSRTSRSAVLSGSNPFRLLDRSTTAESTSLGFGTEGASDLEFHAANSGLDGGRLVRCESQPSAPPRSGSRRFRTVRWSAAGWPGRVR
jgi:hypothetical protein